MPDTTWTPGLLKEYLDAILDEQRRGLSLGEREREHAAAALRENLQERIDSGDTNLLQHIQAQRESVATAFAASEKAILKAEEKTNEQIRIGDEDLKRHIDAQQTTIGRLDDRLNLTMSRELFDAFTKEFDKSRETVVRREVYDQFTEDITEWRRSVDTALTSSKAKNAAYAAALGVLVIVVNLGVFLVSHVR